MITIYKYELQITDTQTISMPSQMKIIKAAEQSGKLWIWALGESEGSIENRRIRIVGTGNPTNVSTLFASFIDTVLMANGLVWHVFELNKA